MSGRERVVVAMSGGVDSSTAAAVLCEQGYDVIGVTLKLYDASGTSASIGGRCCSPRDIDDARATAAHFGFPHYVIDEVDAFQHAVIDDFVDAHRTGRTPNPCVRCNEHVKFGPLLSFAHAIGSATLATGHYARLSPSPGGIPHLQRAVDADKDQSYFLFGVRLEILQAVQFPLGGLTKAQVREQARRLGLPNAEKPDSQQICFIPDGDHKAFVERAGGAGRPGLVVDEQGEPLGAHGGTHQFTIGQRKGVPGRDGRKRFVLSIHQESGTVHTGPREALLRDRLAVEDVRWLQPQDGAFRARVQFRHRGAAHLAVIAPEGAGAVVTFDDPVEGPAPGQAAVFYRADDVVVGGGWIASAS